MSDQNRQNRSEAEVQDEWRTRGRATGLFKFGHAGTGATQIGVLYEITEECQKKGSKSPWYGTLSSDESLAYVIEVLRASGWDGQDWSKLTGLGVTEVELTFQKKQNKWALEYVNAPGIAMANAMKDADVPKFVKELNERTRKLASKKGGH